MTSLPTLCSFLCCSALLAACSKPGPTAVGPDSAVSVPTATAPAASPTSAPTPDAKAPEKPAAYDVNTKSITAKSGTHFVLLLPATISTPMKWRMQPPPDAAVLTLAGESYTEAPPTDCAGCTGYPGTKQFEFEAHAAGKQTLHLAYGSLTDPKAKPEKELSIDVTVE
ncbi:MAG: protease inhibitor I42 family protein [Polyangiaceae bacterium]